MNKVLVCGGTGFLGSHVVEALSEAGYAVRVFDQRPSSHLREGQEMIVGDMLDLGGLCKAARGCSAVYNFAAIADIDESRKHPLEALKVNVLGNAHALEAARQAKAERFVLASSLYVYSRSGAFYRATKQAAEQYTETFQEEFGLDYTIVRYGSLYGRRADERNGIFRMLQSALTEGRVRYAGTGEELREYIHVDDAARLSVEILKPEFKNMPVTLTGHHPMRVRDVMEMVREMLGGKVKLEFDNEAVSGHYNITPYSYSPKLAKKLVSTLYTDMGQGLLDCLAEIQARRPAGPKSRKVKRAA
ncbi:MAG: NAD(P)-dependent oxidoreductase [Elusimicrobiota bacterium]